MHRTKQTQRFLALIGLCVALLSSSACGGSEDDPTTSAGGALFTPIASPPAPGSINMQPGAASGQAFKIRVTATGISNVFGAAFHVTFNSNVMRFDSVDSSTSVLNGAFQTSFSATPVAGHPSELAVVATRVQNAGGTVPSVDITQGDLIVLNFHAIATTAGTAINFAVPREACDETALTCGPVSPVPAWSGGVLTAN